jgi:hypothetical protein
LVLDGGKGKRYLNLKNVNWTKHHHNPKQWYLSYWVHVNLDGDQSKLRFNITLFVSRNQMGGSGSYREIYRHQQACQIVKLMFALSPHMQNVEIPERSRLEKIKSRQDNLSGIIRDF